jgi:energy-coupling factor transporter ATP-binding protein EcfA2
MRSEIRDSTVRDLLEKVQKQNYGTYLKSMRLERIRGFRGSTIDFDFPITALIGPNGSGKSTILGAAACIYSTISPPNIFRKSRIGDKSMDDWLIEYDVIDKHMNPTGTTRAQVVLKSNEWIRSNTLTRPVELLALNRTVPPVDNPLFQFRKHLSVHCKRRKNFTISTEEVPNIDHIKNESERILGVSLKKFKLYEVTFTTIKQMKQSRIIVENIDDLGDGRQVLTRRKVPIIAKPKIITQSQLMYVGATGENTYSEFNFGSGESSVIRMVADIESQPEGSLILIEEIENGLHPIAVRRMVEYLIDVAERKRIQTIFTTHSDYALSPLPSEAIWACIDGKLQQGKLSVEALRAISGQVDRRLAVFVEDDFAKSWIETIVREYLGEGAHEIGVYPVQGDGNALKTHVAHTSNPAVLFHSVCFIDGDSQQKEDEASFIYRLPGSSPESTIFNSVLANIDQNIALLTVGCQRPITKQDEVDRVIREVSRTNRDSHVIFNQVGLKLGFVSESIVKGAFLSVWVQENKADAERIAGHIKKALELPLKPGRG